MYNAHRPRRTRQNAILRDLAAETNLVKGKLIMPYFVQEGSSIHTEIPAMPGIYRSSLDRLLREIESDANAGIRSILLFGIPETKDEAGTGAYSEKGIIQQAVRAVKQSFPELLVITDVCLCEYTSHGHCGLIRDGVVDNDATLELLAQTALSHAQAGADVIAPSDMMDGRVGAIRDLLDDNGYSHLPILSYAAKYASAFYGPFRDAAGSAPQFGDRTSYQMDYRNAREALKEVLMDIDEGADMVMVKPALAYLDIIAAVKQECLLPVCAYNVSGEYTMVKVMQHNGFGDEKRLVSEILGSMVRAGADMIISYHTRDMYRKGWL